MPKFRVEIPSNLLFSANHARTDRAHELQRLVGACYFTQTQLPARDAFLYEGDVPSVFLTWIMAVAQGHASDELLDALITRAKQRAS